ncbi:glycosyltransferase [Clostridium ganghwense]|uniref:Glycosyltransferase n=1 Tax=Clostridium ganghwense TaxID=312089 RepID=A0ABT4CW27_9CLOT|nr:glycosyltransferase [Clostridium ganghwense]MCY6372613.1 glycosyltransferase [Clostridium ganghwense]
MNLNIIKNKILVISTVIVSLIYLGWRIFFTIPFEYGIIAVVSGMYLLIIEIIGMFEAGIHFYNMTNVQCPKCPKIENEQYPDVDVFIATYNEPVELLYKTINGCLNMDYPHKSKVHIYLCDDGNRQAMKDLCNKMNIGYITRTERKHAKAGNLNNAMAYTSSPLIVTMDADMIPMHDFLTACIPYFFTEEKVGFVQTPQSFYNPDLFQFNLYSESRIPNEQDYFYHDIQVGRNKSNSVIYGGSNTIISRQALDEIGGFCTGVITEDFATGMLIQSKGYKCYALNDVHASGLSPSDLKSLIKQRERWARGCIQTGRKNNIIFKKGFTISQKLNYIASVLYWFFPVKRLIYIMAPILFTVFNIIVVKCTLLEVLIFWLPMYLLTNTCISKLSGNIRNTKWTNVYENILFPSLLFPVILETFCISQRKFAVTRKDKVEDDRKYQLMRALPHVFFAILSAIGIVNCIRWTFTTGSIGMIVVLFWLLINFYNILMSILFMTGRKVYRKYERSMAKVGCTIANSNFNINCLTYDISEEGFSVILDFPKYIDYKIENEISLKTDRYASQFKAKIVHVSNIKELWKYSFKIVEIKESEKRQLLQIIYDRVPSLPRILDKDVSTFEDLRINTFKRAEKGKISNRKLSRFALDESVEAINYGVVRFKDFNYEYIRIDTGHDEPENLIIPLEYGIILKCTLVTFGGKRQDKLYKITNYKSFAQDKNFESILQKWIDNFNKLIEENKKVNVTNNTVSDELDEMSYL